MHLLNRIHKVVDVDLEYVIVELCALLNEVRLNHLILSDLIVYIGLDVHWQVFFTLLRELLGDLALETEGVALGRNCE